MFVAFRRRLGGAGERPPFSTFSAMTPGLPGNRPCTVAATVQWSCSRSTGWPSSFQLSHGFVLGMKQSKLMVPFQTAAFSWFGAELRCSVGVDLDHIVPRPECFQDLNGWIGLSATSADR
jgi:hypothetical protein